MAQNLQLSDEVYDDLKKLAEARNVTPEEWVEAKVLEERPKDLEERPLSQLLEGLIGAIDSSEEPLGGHPRTKLSDLIAAKLEKQGIKRPA